MEEHLKKRTYFELTGLHTFFVICVLLSLAHHSNRVVRCPQMPGDPPVKRGSFFPHF